MNRKSIAQSRRAWVAILSLLTVVAPVLTSMTDIDLIALVPALDKFVTTGFALVISGLSIAGILLPDKHGKEPEFIAKKR